ncbi:hypothetical protein [Yoonia maritima]|uniref:hypothetical protein n=1 Tax=Yoonia maritima TaxID=1435347 RepID=UPI0013A62AD9|nr:hypothetical protein [Yoonia maritima]
MSRSDPIAAISGSVTASYQRYLVDSEHVVRDGSHNLSKLSDILAISRDRFLPAIQIAQNLVGLPATTEHQGHLEPVVFRWFSDAGRETRDMLCAVKGKMTHADRHVVLLSRHRGLREITTAAHAGMGISIMRSVTMAGLAMPEASATLARRGLALSRLVQRKPADLSEEGDWSFLPIEAGQWHGFCDRSHYALALKANLKVP